LDLELSLPDYLVHSQNPVGKGNIEGISKRIANK
jgi:hypothetical protein